MRFTGVNQKERQKLAELGLQYNQRSMLGGWQGKKYALKVAAEDSSPLSSTTIPSPSHEAGLINYISAKSMAIVSSPKPRDKPSGGA